ncbi:hypothetical protein KIH45_06410 [Croceicoccus sp. 1NDH52]|nr:hypothetical protein [Croceicoccus gelatinilyticus]
MTQAMTNLDRYDAITLDARLRYLIGLRNTRQLTAAEDEERLRLTRCRLLRNVTRQRRLARLHSAI